MYLLNRVIVGLECHLLAQGLEHNINRPSSASLSTSSSILRQKTSSELILGPPSHFWWKLKLID